ncbi:MAG: AAA-associated domain-containing protein [Nitrososphaerales archaeon]
MGQVIGLLEVLEDFGGRVDVAKVADDLMLNLDELLPVVEAAELLGFLKVDSGDIILTDEGKKFLAEGSSGRKKMLNQLVANLGTYKAVLHYISSHNGEVSKDDLLNFLRTKISDEDAETTYNWLVEWGRHSLLLRYDSNAGKIKIQKRRRPPET